MVTENPYQRPWKDSDIVLVLQDAEDESKTEEFHCHSTILALNSPVFEGMFKADHFKEGREKRATLSGKEREAFILFLDMMYPPTQSMQLSLGKRKKNDNGENSQTGSGGKRGRMNPVRDDDDDGRRDGRKRARMHHPPRDDDDDDQGGEPSAASPSPSTTREKVKKRDALKLFSTVLDYASEYLVECVRLRVDQVLSLEVHSRITGYEEPKRDLKTCFEVLLVADTYKLNRLKAACLSYIWMSDDNFLYEETCAKKLSPETQCILMKLEINKLGIADKREKRLGRERGAPLIIEISDTVQRNLINLSEYHDADFFYNNSDYLMNLSVFETHLDNLEN